MITQRINLNLVPGGAPERIRCSQYDSGSRVLDLALYNGDVPFDATGCTAVIQGTKIDDTGFQYACTVDGTHVYADITQQMTVYSGQVPCEIRLAQNDEILGTANFLLIVERSALSDDTIISDTELPLIEQAAEIATTIAATAEQVATDADRAEDALSNIYTGLASKQDILTAGDNITIEGATISADVITDYEDLTSIPTLDGTEIKGTLTKAGLNIATATDLATKQDALTAGTNITIEDNVISATVEGGTTDYTELTNKPQINNVELSGNKSLSALGIASESDLSALTTTVGTKADASTVESLATTVSSKADQSDLTALATTVSGKQDTLSFDAEPTEDSANPVTSGGVYDALADKAEQSEVDDITENTESETATVTGNPLTLTDALATDAISVVAEIEPSQDLHGYGKPWAGGAGKNKLPMVLADIKSANTSGTWSGNSYTLNDVTFTVNTDDDGNVTGITANGTATMATRFVISNSVSPSMSGNVLNGFVTDGSTQTYFMLLYGDGEWQATISQRNEEKTIPSLTQTATLYIQVNESVTVTNVPFYPMIRLATETDATFEPYSNICQISGMDSVNVQRTGKNLMNAKITLPSSPFSLNNPFPRKYVISAEETLSTGNWYFRFLTEDGYITDGSRVGLTGWDISASTHFFYGGANSQSQAFTVPSGVIRLDIGKLNADGTINGMLELGSTATPYEPYSGTTATASLGTTIYGGSVDMTEGSGSVTYKHITLSSEEQLTGFTVSSAYGAFATVADTTDVKVSSAEALVLCSKAKSVAYNDRVTDYTSFRIWSDTNNNAIYIRASKDANVQTVSELYSYFADADIVYPLATPTTLSLTPTTLAMLEGENTVSTDAEEVSVEYVKNTLAGRVKHLEDESGVIDYSTEEQKTGQKWIDGKEIYQKTIDCGTISGTSDIEIDHNITGIDNVVSISGILKDGYGVFDPLPYATPAGLNVMCRLSISATKIILTKGSVIQDGGSAYVTIRYTKTT